MIAEQELIRDLLIACSAWDGSGCGSAVRFAKTTKELLRVYMKKQEQRLSQDPAPTDSTNPRSTPGEADAQNQTIMPNYEAFNRDLNLFLKESGDSIERFLSHEQKQREQYIEALRKHHDIPHEPDLPETGTQQDTPATVS